MIRRHRLIEQFLVQTLSMNWDGHEEAEHMSASASTVDRIDGTGLKWIRTRSTPWGATELFQAINEYHTIDFSDSISFRVVECDQSPVF